MVSSTYDERTTVKVELVIHTTCDVEFELVEQGTGKVVMGRSFVCEEGNYDAEADAKVRMKKYCESKGFDLVGEVWS